MVGHKYCGGISYGYVLFLTLEVVSSFLGVHAYVCTWTLHLIINVFFFTSKLKWYFPLLSSTIETLVRECLQLIL